MTLQVADIPPTQLDHDALEAALRAAEPNVLLAHPWLLQAVIARELKLMPAGLNVPDEQLFVIPRARLSRFVEDQELPVPEDLPAGETIYLLERPDAEALRDVPADQVLLRYWRLLVRARAEANARAAVDREATDPAGLRTAVRRRIDGIGPDVFNEARHVLRRERRLAAGASDLDVYAKFAAALTELRHFAPRVLPHVFPAIEDADAVAAVVAADVGVDVVPSLRPPGAPDLSHAQYQPLDPPKPRRGWRARVARWFRAEQSARADRARERREARDRRDDLLAAAERAAEVGNNVRAAICRAQAYRGERPDGAAGAGVPTAALRDLDRLAERLRAALHLDRSAAGAWRDALRPLLAQASYGWWRIEGRLLYDLQKVCVDHEREVYSVNVVEWLAELCRKPLYRPLPKQRMANAARHLQAAAHRLARCRLSELQRERLSHLLHDAHHHAEHRLRAELAPAVDRALDAVDMVPRNAVEAVGRAKMVQEMLDAVLRDGYLNFPGVRDAISRNALRCHDLRSIGEWVGYDQLMKLDRRLGDELDGVYRRGEVYRYAFQKLSSLLFANPPGRFLTKTVILPVAGGYLILEALQHTVGLLLEKVFHVHTHMLPVWKPSPDPVADPRGAQAVAAQVDPTALGANPWTFVPWAATAVLLLLLINSPAFRRAAGRAAAAFFRQAGFVLFELPERLLKDTGVLAVATSRGVRLALRYMIKPLAVAAAVAWLLLYDAAPAVQAVGFALAFLLVNVLLNSRPGRALEQSVLYSLRVGWVRFTADKVGTFGRGIMRFFGRMLEAVDRTLYAVDEWLRFRGGGGRGGLVAKAAVGVVWFYIAYVFRFVINLLVEPQVNPIKHFPVVTVSHKLLLPLAIPGGAQPSPLGSVIVYLFGASKATADATAATIVWGIPGIFGFLAWELKENWKLYRANLPATLKPVRFGSHGESVAHLLRPGFHSGTLPKAFAKLRRAHQSADAGRRAGGGQEFPLAVHKHLEAIAHVGESLRRFVERAFLAQLNAHPAFAAAPVALGDTKLGAARVVLVFERPAASGGPMRVEFEQVGGWIVAEVPARGWAAALPPAAAAQFAVALRGFFKMSAVDLVRDDVDACFAPRRVWWDVRPKVLLARPDDRPDVEATYALHERAMRPSFGGGPADPALPILRREQLLFRATDVTWQEWVAAWGGGAGAPAPGPRGVPVVVADANGHVSATAHAAPHAGG